MPQGTACTSLWTCAEVEYLWENYERFTPAQLSENLNKRFRRNRTATAVRKKLATFNLKRLDYDPYANRSWEGFRQYLDEQREQRASIPDTVFTDARVASIYHLIDLKRAGHKQGHGELRIPNGEGLKRFATPANGSYMGSPAYECAS
jgi:hypothetical protein